MKIWQVILLIALTALCLGVVAYGKWNRVYDLKTERSAARSAGVALSAEEFVRTPPPASRNAAVEYNQLVELMKKAPLKDDYLETDSTGRIPPRQTAQLKALVSSRQDVAKLVHAAIAKPDAFWEHQWTAAELLPYCAQIRTAAKWIRWESVLLAREGRYTEAVKHQALGMRVAEHAAQDPLIIAYLVSIACENITLNGFVDILTMAGPNKAVADAVLHETRTNVVKRNLGDYFQGEVLFGLTTMRQITSIRDIRNLSSSEGEQWPVSKGKPGWFIRWVILDPSEAVYLHWMMKQITAVGEPFESRNAAMAAVRSEWDKANRNRPSYVFASLVIPVFDRICERESDLVSRRNAVLSVASVMAYRARTGHWPKSLGETMKAVPLDWQSGKPVNYKRERGGFVVSTKADTEGLSKESARKARERLEIRYPVPPEREAAPPSARHPMLPPHPAFPGGPPR